MTDLPQDKYLSLMNTIRYRLDLAMSLSELGGDEFSTAETVAFHGRKIIEGIAFGCLVATEHGLKNIPKDSNGQWNAEKILASLKRKKITTFPSPSIIRLPTDEERDTKNVKAVIEGIEENRIPHVDLISIYQSFHRWLHEINPYVGNDRDSFVEKYKDKLWDDIACINKFIEKHFIAISGEGFYCTLRDDVDGSTKLISVSKVAY